MSKPAITRSDFLATHTAERVLLIACEQRDAARRETARGNDILARYHRDEMRFFAGIAVRIARHQRAILT